MALEIRLQYDDALGITGGNTKAGREDTTAVIELKHNVRRPFDKQMGRPTGTRIHGPVVARTPIDKSTPLLWKALTDGEVLPAITFIWSEVTPEGIEEDYFQMALENVRVQSMEVVLPNTKDKALEDQVHQVETTFAYEKMTYEHLTEKVMHTDGWTVPA